MASIKVFLLHAGMSETGVSGMEIAMRGIGYQVGGGKELNADAAVRLGLDRDWLVQRTGIRARRMCAEGEDASTLAADALGKALRSAGLEADRLGQETVLVHIENGFVNLAPPAAVALAARTGLTDVRVLGVDGVCSEPMTVLDLASSLFETGRADRVVLSAAFDYERVLDPTDAGTVGLFGAGACAVVLEPAAADDPRRFTLLGTAWRTDAQGAGLGVIPVRRLHRDARGVHIDAGFYAMDGQGLTRIGLRAVPLVYQDVLRRAAWRPDGFDLVIAHQPNVKLLEILMRKLEIPMRMVPTPVEELGNMGPASLLINLAIAMEKGLIKNGTKVMLLAFGLGFSCGAAAIEFHSDFSLRQGSAGK
ncbi:3-oxoacyl-[acyl-carrier-protein] synthase 3 [Streptomyces griseoviridis]|uniref:3-oxoacyl-[acyl-carrier-protein] synthase 3 n=2 Tax=Streptomyces griseoviridis TaxID=45398 RepID=A0A918G8B3_STRGD|nr:3-oxoacyl-[acyl-carrier-protein] synthase 3 [Streptomyces niveoruber]